VQATTIVTSSQNEHVVITTEEPKPIRGGVDLNNVVCTLSLPTESVEVHVVIFSTQVEELEEHIIPKLVPLTIPKIGVGAKVKLIDIITHAFEVFKA